MQPFDLLETPIEGRNLIEASAGTGKTYALAGLYVRLLLEKRLPVERILVVTFTVPATGELRDRIRRLIRQTLDAFVTGASDDAFVTGLVRRTTDPAEARILLTDALRSFDEAAIYTIHGFCQRVLADRAFESGSLFDTELVTDPGELVAEVRNDFWRNRLYDASPAFARYVCAQGFGVAGMAPWDPVNPLARNAGGSDAAAGFAVLPEAGASPPGTAERERACCEAYERLRNAWRDGKEEVEKILSESPALSGTFYPRRGVPAWIAGLEEYLDGGDPLFPFERLGKFGAREIARGTKKKETAPVHPLFGMCDALSDRIAELSAAFDERLMNLRRELLSYVRTELARRKGERNVRSFDDLLLSLRDALAREGGGPLAAAVREKYRAALVDEFQDTDPVQYAIFDALFSESDSLLFLIGDPKQAIYSFRNADVFAYLEAKERVTRRYTLGTNYRSVPGLVDAVNAIFSEHPSPFLVEGIPFLAAAPSDKMKKTALRIDGMPDEAPFRIWLLRREKGKGTIGKGEAEELIPAAVAGEIRRLLAAGGQGRATIDGRPVGPGDVAILVRKNDQARRMRKALADLDIPGVIFSSESLFSSREAREVMRVLTAVADPNDESAVRAALATDLMGCSGEAIAALLSEEDRWNDRLEAFRRYREQWDRHGFMPMARTLIAREGGRSRLLSFADGDRRVTNLLHCLEVLHRAAAEERLGPEGLLKWFARQVREGPGEEEYQIRLETDEKAVMIATIHRSKGLQYPIVFCPYGWDGSRARDDVVVFHDPANRDRPTLDLGSGNREAHKAMAERELLAENLRLFYVALTRARYRCYLVWGAINEADTSAPAWLFHARPAPGEEGANPLEALSARFGRLDDPAIEEEIARLAERSKGRIAVSPAPPPAGERHVVPADGTEELRCPPFTAKIASDWRLSSFSFLAAGRGEGFEVPGRDEGSREEAAVSVPEPSPPLSGDRTFREFPRGTNAGLCLHKILEEADYADGDPEALRRTVRQNLVRFGFDRAWEEPVARMVRDLLAVPLVEGKGAGTLSSLSRANRINEMEFHFPVRRIRSEGLREAFRRFGGPDLPAIFPLMLDRLDFVPSRGFLKGYIDLVFHLDGRFYLADWKSNDLGPRVEDYHSGALQSALAREYYFLQFVLYAVALHKHLALRVPGYDYDAHFGGVFYVFLRGVDPSRPGYGIYRDRPSRELVDRLCRYFEEG